MVFLGRVEKTAQDASDLDREEKYIGEQRASVRVEEAFKGVRSDDVLQLEQPGDNCTPKFEEGERVVFYLNPAKTGGKWVAYGCHRTRSVQSAADDLQFLRALPWAAKRSRMSGTVSVYADSLESGFRLERYLSGIEVEIRGGEKLIETITNSAGVYEIYDLPEGVYQVGLKTPKGLKVRFPMVAGGIRSWGSGNSPAINIKPGGGVSVDFILSEDNVVAGRLLDLKGKPMNDVRVELEPATGSAGRHFYASNYSKGDGEFRIDNMPAGEYLLVANRSGRKTGQAPFPAVYFPGTEDRQKARVLKIGVGEHREGLEIRIPRIERMITVSGRVQFSDGQPVLYAGLSVVISDPSDSDHLKADSSGRFRIPLVAGAPKRLRAELSIYNEALLKTCPQIRAVEPRNFSVTLQSQDVEVQAERDEEGLVLTLPVKSCPALVDVPTRKPL